DLQDHLHLPALFQRKVAYQPLGELRGLAELLDLGPWNSQPDAGGVAGELPAAVIGGERRRAHVQPERVMSGQRKAQVERASGLQSLQLSAADVTMQRLPEESHVHGHDQSSSTMMTAALLR